jgi:hypothetical protein
MKYRFCFLWIVLSATGTVFLGCDQSKLDKKSSKEMSSPTPPASQFSVRSPDDPPSVSNDTPLLLLDEGTSANSDNSIGADNARCFVCHMNYMQEQLTVGHAKANIGCIQCHGVSDAHIADESWASGGNGTAPDIMYPLEKIDPSCVACHEVDKLTASKHAEYLLGELKDKKTCVDCHGQHRMVIRRCKWK